MSATLQNPQILAALFTGIAFGFAVGFFTCSLLTMSRRASRTPE